jgi:hypothetical protein
MKTILLILSVSFAGFLHSQDLAMSGSNHSIMLEGNHDEISPINLRLPSNNSYRHDDGRVGPLVMMGGAVFILAGLLTVPTYKGGSATEQKPFFQQGGRMLAIMSGSIMIPIGSILTICGY